MSSKQKFLMCPTDYFRVRYVINPWMEGHINQVNRPRAAQQWQDLCNIIQQYAQVELLPSQPKMPDLVFTANAGFIHRGKAVLSNFRPKQRRLEQSINQAWFEQHQYSVVTLADNIFFEGEGDTLRQPGMDVIWMGCGIRSEERAAQALSETLDTKVIALHLTDPRFYHLDTCFCPLADGYLLYFREGFDKNSQQAIDQLIAKEKQITISEEDALRFACNAITIHNDDKVIILNDASKQLQQRLEAIGYQVITMPLDEFMKSGGAAKCLVLQL